MSNFISLSDLLTPFWTAIQDRPVFCGFKIIGEQKVPVGLDGQIGLGADASIERFGTYKQIKAMNFPFVGLSLMNPIMVDGKYLLCLDFDWKRAPGGNANIEQIELIAELQKLNAYYETSYSGKGAHFWILCELANIPRSIKLSNNCEIEVFSGLPNAKSNVLITDYDIEGELKLVHAKSLFPQIQVKEKPSPKLGSMTVNISDNFAKAKEVLRFIPADDYEEWVRVGMVLKGEFGNDAYDLWNFWSSQSDSYNPEIMFAKWNSFNGTGLTIATLVAMGKEHGYEVSQGHKTSPQQDFGVLDEATGDYVFEPVVKVSLLTKAYIAPVTGLQAPQWVIDGVIPNGVGVIAGVGGVGKTTALMPLAATVAGFSDHLSDIKVKIHRHVIYITEDSVQAQKAIFAIKKWRKSDKDISKIDDHVHLYNSTQYKINDLKALLIEAATLYSCDYRGINFAPLVIFDTASANIAVDNENDNAEIARYMTMFKQLWAKYNMPIWLVNHLAKSANGLSVDELDAHSARGASAWRDNSNWTANLAIDKDTNNRVMQIMKVREELEYNEIVFASVVHKEPVLDIFGDMVEVSYRHCTATKSSKKQRAFSDFKRREEEILRVVAATAYPSKNAIKDQVKGSKDAVFSLIDEMVKNGKLQLLPLPKDVKVRNQDNYYCGIAVFS